MRVKIILASGSKRRSRILKECGIRHRVVVSGADEVMDPAKGVAYNAVTNACRKAEAVSGRVKRGFVIGADTLVLLGKRLIGKPKDEREAKKLLRDFSGKKILVCTGLCVIDAVSGKTSKGSVVSAIRVRKIKAGKINLFLRALAPYDKAGGFSIEGAGSIVFDDVEGSFYNILGLPMNALYDLFKKVGLDLLDLG
jgi:septum formation protein